MYNEFIAATLEAQNRIEEEKLRNAFDRLDADETGYISKKVSLLNYIEYIHYLSTPVVALTQWIFLLVELVLIFRGSMLR